MTEQEWQSCPGSYHLLEFTKGKIGHRKQRLFGCCCCRYIWDLLRDGRSRNAVEISESFADGVASRAELANAHHAAWTVRIEANESGYLASPEEFVMRPGFQAAANTCSSQEQVFFEIVSREVVEAVRGYSGLRSRREGIEKALSEVRLYQAQAFRCIVGNPFRPVAPDSSWMPQNAIILARTMYDGRDFTLMPILADLLEEAGCPVEVAQHCRGGGPHVRGCWVVDLVLGKE